MVKNEKKILIVDDDPLIREGLTQLAKQMGLNPLTAEDGEQAIEIFEKTQIALVITDLILPSMHGISLLKILKGHSAHLPVVVMTAYGQRLAQEAMREGADAYILKPFSTKDVQDILKRFL